MPITPVVKQLLIINIIFFIGSQLPGVPSDFFALYFFENPNFKFWQPLTHMFMHGSVMHIVFNMFALFSFGSVLEHNWGAKKFLFFYISCGLGAALVHTGVNYYYFAQGISHLNEIGLGGQVDNLLKTGGINYTVRPAGLDEGVLRSMLEAYRSSAVGASGAVYGLLIAFAFMYPNAELSLLFIPIPIKAKYFVPVYMILYDGAFGIFGGSLLGIQSGIAHFAHIGGAITGFIMMWYWKKNQFNKNRWN